MDRYTGYYVNQSGGGQIGPVYRDIFRVHRGNSIGSFFRGLFRNLNLSCIRGKGCRKRSPKTSYNIKTNIPNNKPEKPVGAIFKTRFSEAEGNLAEKVKKMTGLAWV